MVSSMMRCTGSMLIRLASMAMKRRPNALTLASVSVGAWMPAAAMSAPASAKANAMPWPRPVLAPVTSATLPSRLNGLLITLSLLLDVPWCDE